ncbi:hypothetical protein [Gimesia chilikensis]|uniref:hypothetical protein n=1 Tax=Gimesia chilikensis TaxID=2605989 RepID=UPI003A8E823D
MVRFFLPLILLFPLSTNAEPTKIIHILNWHYVSRADFAADLKVSTEKPLTDGQINKEYVSFIDDVRAIQKQQMELLRLLINKHDLKAVYVEGLTEKNHKDILEFLVTMKRYEQIKKPPEDRFDRLIEAQHQLDLLHVGAAPRLVMSGELKTVLPAEDSKTMEAANPVNPDGSVVYDLKAAISREDAIARNLLKADGIVVIILGGGHDLTDNIKRAGGRCKYERVTVPKYLDIVEE